MYDARAAYALRVDALFELTGAVVDSRGPLELTVAASDRAALARFVDADPTAAGLRRIVVRRAG